MHEDVHCSPGFEWGFDGDFEAPRTEVGGDFVFPVFVDEAAVAGGDCWDADFVGEEGAAFGGEVEENHGSGACGDADLFHIALAGGEVLEVVAFSPADFQTFVALHHTSQGVVERVEE